uniref:Uncharacterized protein n=1 Tax=Leersia perrieri TaxID=77586 RepID=A0A0D9XQI8_9ORYZ
MTDSFKLFCRKAFLNSTDCECLQELQDVAMAIVEVCQGLPPAIISIGRLLSLRPKSEPAWRKLHDQLQGELAKYGHVQGILNMCYHELPGHLRNCFLYCSLFPEDYCISRESLVRLMVKCGGDGGGAVGHGALPGGIKDMCCLCTLVRLWVAEGFVEKKGRATAEEVGEGYLMQLIHRNMLQFEDRDELGRMDADAKVRRLSTRGHWDMNAASTKFPRHLTLMALGTTTTCPDMLSFVSSGSKYLAVLELQDSDISEVPESIGNLFNLRYIGLRRTKVKSIPNSVEKLCNLQTMDIKQTKIEKLPRGITLETMECSKDFADQLKKLMQLRSVWIDNISTADCANLFASLSSMPFLSSLLLSARDENEPLCFDGLKPRSTELHRSTVDACFMLEEPNLFKTEQHAYLKNIEAFPRLKMLVLKQMPNVDQLKIMNGSLPVIEGLYIVSLPGLETVPVGIETLRTLKKLWLLNLHTDFKAHWIESGMHQKMQHVQELRELDPDLTRQMTKKRSHAAAKTPGQAAQFDAPDAAAVNNLHDSVL